MTIRKRAIAVTLGLSAVVSIGGLPIVAQEPAAPAKSAASSTTTTTTTAKKKQEPSRRVPPYFGQIGLTPEQRENIYTLQAKRFEKINALEKQIAAEKAEMLASCEDVLNETQKKLLDNLRKAAAEPPLKPAPTAKATEASKPSNN